MALKKTIMIQGRFPATYHRIGESRRKHKQHLRLTIYSYPDEQSRRNGEDPLIPYTNLTIPLVETPMTEEEYYVEIDGKQVKRTRKVPGDPVYIEESLPDDRDGMSREYRLLKMQTDWQDAEDV